MEDISIASILVHVTVGPGNPTKAALAFLVAKTVIEEGHQLALFVAGDGVHLLASSIAPTIRGLGTGNLTDHLEALSKGDFECYYSGRSAKAPSIQQQDILLRNAEPAMPTKLVELTVRCDKVLSY